MRISTMFFRCSALFLMAVLFLGLAPAARAAAGNTALKIYEVAGAGALSGATYRQDTIILFNPTAATIACATCAVQTHSGTSNTAAWTVYKLPSFSIPAGGFYMISGSSVSLATYGSVAPIPYDYELQTIELGTTPPTTQNILSSTVGVVALTNTQTALTASSASACGTGTQLLDMVGYGSNVALNTSTTATPATCYSGSGAAYYDGSTAYGRQLGVTRKNRCIDTADNLNDFVNLPPTFFNSTSTPTPCPGGTQLSAAVSATPTNPVVGGSVTFKAVVTPATQPSSAGITATLDFNTPYYGGTTLPMYDDGTHGDVTAGDGVYTLTTTVPSTTASGFVYPADVTVNDLAGDSYTGTTPLNVGGVNNGLTAGNNSLRIIAWYGAGNLSKSEYGRDTVILFNPTAAAISINGWSLQTGGSTGAFTTVYDLPNATIPSGGYFAIAGSGVNYISSAGCVSAVCNLNYAYDYQLKTVEGTETDTDNDLSSTAVTVALANTTTALGSGCPSTSAHLVDLVGVGAADGSSPVTCYAGSSYATYTPATTNGVATNINGIVYAYATVRKNKCGNSFDNANDFMLGFINFANSTTTPDPCPLGNQMSVTTAAATPATVGILDPVTFTTSVTPATNPASTSIAVTADLSNLGLSAVSPFYDDGTHGDKTAGDGVYSLSTAATSGAIGTVTGLIVSAKDAQGNLAQNVIPFVLQAGTFTMTTPTASGAIAAGGVLTFPITIAGQHGYGGVLNITCTGSPNANTLGVPISTQCVSTPSELTLANDGTATISLAIATGTTYSAGLFSGPLGFGLIGLLSIGLLTVGVWRRKHLVSAGLFAVLLLMTLNTTACGKNGGLGNTAAAPGTYTYVVTATDSNIATVTNSLTFTITVQ
ncbi:choice-of-anchor X domain-containing protein [Granulicella rosea]|nr:choice-of-anchor X domain-containing protein [Granulicella rosea]